TEDGARVEVPRFAAHVRLVGGCVEGCDRTGTATTLEEAAPECGDIAADRGHCAQSGDDDAVVVGTGEHARSPQRSWVRSEASAGGMERTSVGAVAVTVAVAVPIAGMHAIENITQGAHLG